MRAFVLALSALAALAVAGCGKSPAAPAPAGGSAAPPSDKQAPGAAATPTKADKTGKADKADKADELASAGAGQPKAGEPTTEAPKPASPKPAAGPIAGDRAKMGEAFVEIYCAQQAGEADKLLAIYKRYGFQDPKAWTKAWTEAAKDEAWIARITERAVAKCPAKR